MKTITRMSHLCGVSALAIMGFAGHALALDATDFANKLAASAEAVGMQASFLQATEEDGNVTIRGIKVRVPDQDDPLPIIDLTFEDVSETDSGYRAERVGFDDVSVTEDGKAFSLKDIEITGINVPNTSDYTTTDNMLMFERAGTGPLAVSENGRTILTVDTMEIVYTVADDDQSVEMGGGVYGIALDVDAIDDAEARKAFDDLGYEKISGEIGMAGTWEIEEGRIAIEDYGFTFDDVGSISMALDISGYTPAFITSLVEAQRAAMENPDKQAGEQAMGLAMLGLMQQLTFNSAEVHFEDDSITGRALEYAGKQQGMDGAQMAQAVKGMAPLMVAQLGIPALQQQVSAAITAFIDNPGTFTVSAYPDEPIAFPMIMGAAMGDPKSLVDMLKVEVVANQ